MIAAAEQDDEPLDLAPIEARISARLAEGTTVKTLVAELGDEIAMPRRELYALVQRLREDGEAS